MDTFVILCLIIAALAFLGETLGVPARVSLLGLGLFAVTLSLLVPLF